MPTIPVVLIYETNISNELAIAVSLSSQPDDYFYKLVFQLFNENNLTPQFVVEFMSRIEYERPTFKKSLLFPFSFIYILNLLQNSNIFNQSDNLEEFTQNYYRIIKNYTSDQSFKISLRKLNEIINHDKTKIKGEFAFVCFNKIFKDNLEKDEVYYINLFPEYKIPFDLYKTFFSNNNSI